MSEFGQVIEVEHRSYECYNREDNHQRAYHLIYYNNAVGIKLASYLVYKPRQSEPPQQRSKDNAEIADGHFEGMVGYDEGKLSIGCHEKKHYQRITQGDEESCQGVLPQGAFLVRAFVSVLHWVGLEAEHTEQEQQAASQNLQIELVLGIVNEVHNEAHAQASYQSIDYVACCCTDTGN